MVLIFSHITGPHCFCSSDEFRLTSCGKESYGVETKINEPDADGNGEVGIIRNSSSKFLLSPLTGKMQDRPNTNKVLLIEILSFYHRSSVDSN